MRVAIVHDWLIGGGAERVVEQLHKLYPDAPIYTSYCTDEWRKRLDGKVKTGYLQYLPAVRKFIPFLRGWWFSRLNLDKYDLVISSSGAEAKFIKVKPGAKHIAYIHAPTHYYWDRYDQYLKHPGFGLLDPLARFGLKLLVGPMRGWDYKAAQKPDYLIANSNYTKAAIKKYYGRESTVIHPPVDIERFKKLISVKPSRLDLSSEAAKLPNSRERYLLNSSRHGFMVAGRQTHYKRLDLAISACSKYELTLRVVGNGPQHHKLAKKAGPFVEFVKHASDDDMVKYLSSAEAFIFPGLDDFGIIAVEAMAAGTPVIAYKAGGALDYVIPGKTGLFFEKQSVDSLVSALKQFSKNTFYSTQIHKHAENFSSQRFQENFKKFLTQIAN